MDQLIRPEGARGLVLEKALQIKKTRLLEILSRTTPAGVEDSTIEARNEPSRPVYHWLNNRLANLGNFLEYQVALCRSHQVGKVSDTADGRQSTAHRAPMVDWARLHNTVRARSRALIYRGIARIDIFVVDCSTWPVKST